MDFHMVILELLQPCSLQSGFFLGIEGGALAAEECRSTSRALPLGTMIGLSVLLIGATTTWFVCSGLVPAEKLGESAYPLYDAALATGKLYVIIALFVGTIMACLASANGCINDASRAWFAMSRDGLIPPIFAKTHPKYKTPYRATVIFYCRYLWHLHLQECWIRLLHFLYFQR